ncbi:Bacterial regulatory protein, gntR family [Candidatus Izimaplasma bacterium HR1]|jgi:DNA-binding transcriptional regulator YhcF (GntR family)|nr:Bacterial regulatory protein, gntR family [Candidatus Izimaplasma bacterium HR1]
MNYIKNKPIYIQIAHDLILKVLNEEIKRATLLPSVRELSVTYKVTPKTIQSVTKYLDDNKVINRKPGVGSVITNDIEVVKELHFKHGLENTKEYLEYMKTLLYSDDEISKYIAKLTKEDI